MAKGKSVPYVWNCQGDDSHGAHITGSGKAQKPKLKDMERNKYCPKVRAVLPHKAKPVKKGGTKALANAK